jgi:hypothetical protein
VSLDPFVADAVADETLKKLRVAVKNKPTGYCRLVNIAWHCYFSHSSPSQTHIAKMIGISTSLVTYYRKLFDSVVRDVQLDADQYVPFLHSFCIRLKTSISEIDGTYDDQ